VKEKMTLKLEIYAIIAATYGHLECLVYFYENGYPWNEKCCEYASENGHLEVLTIFM